MVKYVERNGVKYRAVGMMHTRAGANQMAEAYTRQMGVETFITKDEGKFFVVVKEETHEDKV